MFTASTHNYLLLFTEQGKCHWLRVYELPEASKASSGRVLQNIIALPKDDKVKAYVMIEDLTDEEFLKNNYLIFCTKKGAIKKTSVEAFSRPRTNGIIAISINEGDQLLEARLTNGNNEILMAIKSGRAIRFPESKVRPMGRTASGVRGIALDKENDEVVGMISVDPSDEQSTILVISDKGYGKRSSLEDYRNTNRGGKGVKTISVTDKTGKLAAIKYVNEENDLMITTKSGVIIRIPVADLRVMGRATQGVKVIRIDDGDEIADIAVTSKKEEEMPVDEEGQTTMEEESDATGTEESSEIENSETEDTNKTEVVDTTEEDTSEEDTIKEE